MLRMFPLTSVEFQWCNTPRISRSPGPEPQHLVVRTRTKRARRGPPSRPGGVVGRGNDWGRGHMAIAPEQSAIPIRRHLTKPGEHPYDTLAWEQREARIPNFKDGTDAFFQPDVEFPVSWSQNATNIVAQKYFRGTLDTPEREHSL